VAALAIIPARGGSVRLPRKNIAEFLGKPIIAYTVSAAIESKCFDRVIVSTEDKEIAAVSAKAGAQVLDRKPELATGTATVVEVCLDVLEREEKAGRSYDRFACLYATAPLRNAEDIRATMNLLEKGRCHFAFAVTTWSLPPHQAMKMHEGGRVEAMWPDLVERRSSELGTLVVDNGSTYAAFTDDFRRERTFLGSSMRGHLMPRRRSVDIDEPEDLAIARLFAQETA
jgi:CMP-N-acetylneuraminic acid synthetase